MEASAGATLLSLPDEVLYKIFKHLAGAMNYTLQTAGDAVNLARCNKRLGAIFATQLTRITPIVHNIEAATLSEDRFDPLVRIAGEHLRELHIPDGQHAYVQELPQLCPNLESVFYVERHHVPGWEILSIFASSNDEGDSNDGENNVGENENHDAENNGDGNDAENDDNDGGNEDNDAENNVGEGSSNHGENEDDSSDGEHDSDGDDGNEGEGENNEEDHNDAESVDDGSVGNGGSDDGNHDDATSDDGSSDSSGSDAGNSEEGTPCYSYLSKYNWESCAAIPILPHLKLRKLSITRPRKNFVDYLTNHSLEELHLYDVKTRQLSQILPLLSKPLKALTITVGAFEFPHLFSDYISDFIQSLIPLVPQIGCLTLEIPTKRTLWTTLEVSNDRRFFDFPNHTDELIEALRNNNTFESKCTKVNLNGWCTFRVLPAVNRNAVLSLSLENVTVVDDGEHKRITGLPLEDEFINVDVTYLESAYILPFYRRREREWNPEWRRHLAGRKLRVIRTTDARVLSTIGVTAERLELFCGGISDVTDWTMLSDVTELYLLGIPSEFEERDRHRTIDVVEALPRMIDSFNGKLIWLGIYGAVLCRDEGCLQDLRPIANQIKDSVDRFIKRGGDAATLVGFVDMLRKVEGTTERQS